MMLLCGIGAAQQAVCSQTQQLHIRAAPHNKLGEVRISGTTEWTWQAQHTHLHAANTCIWSTEIRKCVGSLTHVCRAALQFIYICACVYVQRCVPSLSHRKHISVICKTEHWWINLTFFILFDFSSFTPIAPLPPSLFFSLWPSQNSNEIKWSLICMHLQNIACAVFAIKGMEKRVAVVLVGVYVLPHWHQTVLWYGNGGQGKNGCSLWLCLDIGQGLFSCLFFSLSLLFSFYSFS